MSGQDDFSEPWNRMRWARERAGFARKADAASALQIAAPTYRTYERATEDGGRWPTNISLLQRIANKFGVDWVWLATGKGQPMPDRQLDEEAQKINERVYRIPAAKRSDAVNAAISVLESYIRKA